MSSEQVPNNAGAKAEKISGNTPFLQEFSLRAIVLFGAFLAIYLGWFVDSAAYKHLLAFNVENVSRLLDAIKLEHSTAFDRQAGFAELRTDVGGGIVNGGLVVIDRSSDAFYSIAVLLAVVLAWPGKLLRKFLFAAIGVVLLVLLNLARMAALLFIDHHAPLYFPIMNEWVFPATMVCVALVFFYACTRFAGVRPL